MPVSKIYLFPDPILRKPSKIVTHFDKNLQAIIKNLVLTMKSQPLGIGIAAPQIGILMQIAVVDVSARVKRARRLYLINPEVLETRDEIISREGCMSLPEYTAYLKRFNWVRVKWTDQHGKSQVKTSEGIEAICIQHEMDHLKGQLFIDRVTSLKTDMMPRGSRPRRRKSIQ